MSNRIPAGFIRPTNLQIALWAAVLVSTLALSLYDWTGYQVGTYGDDGSYVTNTDSLLERVPYGTLLTPGEDRVTQFPFGLPMLLAPVRAWFPASLDALRVIPLGATLLALSALFWGWGWIGRGFSPWWGLAVTALTALSPITILHARTIMSEAPFFVFSLLMVVWVERILQNPPRAWGIVLGILAVCLLYMRSIGWLFVAIWLAYLFWKRGRYLLPQMGVAVLTAASLLAVVLVTTTVRPVDLLPQEYLAQFTTGAEGAKAVRTGDFAIIPPNTSTRNFAETLLVQGLVHLDIADKLPYQMELAVKEWTGRNGLSWLRYLPGIGALGVLCLGLALWWRKTGLSAFLVIVPPYLALLFLWNWNGARLFYPIQPQLVLSFLLGLVGVLEWVAARLHMQDRAQFAGRIAAGVTVLGLLASVWLDLNFTRSMLLPGDQMSRARQLEATIPGGAVVLSTRATTDHLYVARTFIDIPVRLASTQELVEYMRRHAVDYVVTHNGVGADGEKKSLRVAPVNRFLVGVEPLIKAGALEPELVDDPNDMAIYRVKKDALSLALP